MQKEEKEQELTEEMKEILVVKEELQEVFHQMISASIVKELVIGLRIVLKKEVEEVEVVQETEETEIEIEVLEEIEIEVIELTEVTEVTEMIEKEVTEGIEETEEIAVIVI